MEEYLQNMKTLRSQMNDVEDHAAKISVEEQTQLTAIHAMEKDLHLAKSETRRLKDETERMVKAKGQICSQILEKQKKFASLEADSSTLSQTLELIQQERVNISSNLKEKRSYYTKVMEEMSAKLEERQEWINSNNLNTKVEKTGELEGKNEGRSSTGIHLIVDNPGYETNKNFKDIVIKLDYAKAKLEEITANKSKLVLEISKMKQGVEQLKCRTAEFPPALRTMDAKALEEEHKALLSDKAEETEYLQTLQKQIEQLKGISHIVKCACGVEYKIEV